jgi:long-subunit fatty acid transport protein
MIDLNLGGSYTIYQEGSKNYTGNLGSYTETYNKSTWIIGAGLNFFFGKN